MHWIQLPLGLFQTNCYILINSKKEALIIDPGAEFEKVNHVLEEEQAKPIAILLTHAHLDHIGAVDDLRNQWKIPAYLHIEEEDWLMDPDKNGSSRFPGAEAISLKPADVLLEGEKTLTLGVFSFECLETPGHSPGSLSFYFKDKNVIFSGDTLFNGGIGRTDLYRGDAEVLMETIESKLLGLPDETVVAPGHGFETTIGQEKDTNPFLL
ncbi:MAG TPA: MBL fold metallo-hydrolase [Candidatus Angelobacter sp.]|nr:MBL fold metallo-hydrolase [Candidatus Angelobacter sp.]